MPRPDELKRVHDAAVLAAVEAQGRGSFGLALTLFEESLEHALAMDEPRKIHFARINISSCWLSLGEWARAKEGLAAIVLESDGPQVRSAAAVQLAEALLREGLLEKAAHYLKLAVESARQAADVAREICAMAMQGHLAGMEGRYADAVMAYAAAVELRAGITEGAVADMAVLLDKLGHAQLLAGDVAKGLWTLRRSLALARQRQNEWAIAEARVDLAFGFLLAERNATARREALLALEMACRHGYEGLRKASAYVLMEVALREGQERDFERWFAELQGLMPGVRLSRDFFRIFDISDVISLKEM
jgi:tetratricopeptide (TPR) repeat protein